MRKSDEVNNPPHYNTGSVECINGIEAALGPEGSLSYFRGNILKYVWRCMYKGKPLEDLRKARWYLDRAIQALESVVETPTLVETENPPKDTYWFTRERPETD